MIHKSNVPPTFWQTIENGTAKMAYAGKWNYLSEDAIKLFGQVEKQRSSKAMLKFIDNEKYLLSSYDKDDTEEYAVLLVVE